MGGVSGIGAASGAYTNPALLGMLLPNFNATAYQKAMQVPVTMAEAGLAQLSTQNQTLGKQVSAWQTIQNDLAAVNSAAQALEQSPATGTPVYGKIAVQSSATSQVQATTTHGVAGSPGVYTIGPASGKTAVVLAQNEIVNSASQSSATTGLGLAGTFSIQGKSISVSSSSTLQDIATAINAAGAGVTASVMEPSGGGYVLSIQGDKAGPLTFSDPNGILAHLGIESSSGTPNIVQAYRYAQYSVNGVSVTKGGSNTDASTIPGVTFTLTGTAGATLTVTQNTKAVQSGVASLVSAVNQLLSDAQSLGGKGGLLEGSATLQGIVSGVEQAMGTYQPSQPGGYQSGSQVGLTLSAPVGSPTKLKAALSDTAFSSALASDPSAVASLLGGSSGIATTMANIANEYAGTTGALQQRIQSLQQQQTQVQQQISDPLSAANEAITFARQQAQQDWTALVQALVAQQSQSGILSGMLAKSGGKSSSGG